MVTAGRPLAFLTACIPDPENNGESMRSTYITAMVVAEALFWSELVSPMVMKTIPMKEIMTLIISSLETFSLMQVMEIMVA